MKAFLIILISLLSIQHIKAQSIIKITGRVLNEKNEVVEFANVSLSNVTNSTILSAELTNSEGKFELSIPYSDKYILNIDYLGYSEHIQEINIKQTISLDDIKLFQKDIILEEIVVIARRKLIKQDKGRIEMNVVDSELSKLSSSLDVLSIMPGIIVSGTELSVVGRGKPLIILNGRELKNIDEVANLSPDRIKKIVLDRNPSSQYDAAYTSILFIETKDQLKDQLSAQLIHRSGIKRNYNHNETININHKNGKFTNFMTYKFEDGKNHDIVENYQNIYSENNLISNKNNSNSIDKKQVHSLNLSTLIDINEKNQLSLQYNMNYENQKLDVSGNEIRTATSPEYLDVFRNSKSSKKHNGLSLNYSLKLDSLNHIIFFGDYIHHSNNGLETILSQNQKEQFYRDNLLKGNSNFNTYSFRAEYNTKLFVNYDFLFGIRYSDISNHGYSDLKSSDSTLSFQSRSKLNEQTSAVYGTLSREIDDFYIEAGVRGELNVGRYFYNDSSVFNRPRKLSNIFPSLMVSYDISEKTQLNLNYNSKINRPDFEDIDPRINYLSSALYEQGNPVLKPSMSHNISFGASFDNGLTLSGSFIHHKDLIAYAIIPFDKQNEIWVNTPINIPNSSLVNLNATYSKMFGKLISNLVGDISFPFIKYNYQGNKISNNTPKYQLVSTNIYRLNQKIFFVGNLAISSKYDYINTTFDPTYRLTLAFNITLLDGKLDLSLFGNDILAKGNPNTISRYGSVKSGQRLNLDTRMVGLTAKLNLNKFKNIFKPNDSNQPELERISK